MCSKRVKTTQDVFLLPNQTEKTEQISTKKNKRWVFEASVRLFKLTQWYIHQRTNPAAKIVKLERCREETKGVNMSKMPLLAWYTIVPVHTILWKYVSLTLCTSLMYVWPFSSKICCIKWFNFATQWRPFSSGKNVGKGTFFRYLTNQQTNHFGACIRRTANQRNFSVFRGMKAQNITTSG